MRIERNFICDGILKIWLIVLGIGTDAMDDRSLTTFQKVLKILFKW